MSNIRGLHPPIEAGAERDTIGTAGEMGSATRTYDAFMLCHAAHLSNVDVHTALTFLPSRVIVELTCSCCVLMGLGYTAILTLSLH